MADHESLPPSGDGISDPFIPEEGELIEAQQSEIQTLELLLAHGIQVGGYA